MNNLLRIIAGHLYERPILCFYDIGLRDELRDMSEGCAEQMLVGLRDELGDMSGVVQSAVQFGRGRGSTSL